MKKSIIIGAIAVLVVVGGGVATFAALNRDGASNNENSVSLNSESNKATIQQASIEDLLTQNASLKCTYSVTEENGLNTGTAYFSGNKNMYGEFVSPVNGKDMLAYIIRNGDTQYVWTKDSTDGFKINVSTSNKETQQRTSQEIDPEKKYEFSCVNWQKDESLFTPPASVTFTDISEQSRQIQEAMNSAAE